MNILLLGHTGQVGWELHRALLPLGQITALDYPDIDLADPNSIRTAVRATEPNLVINAAAYTDVDKAESEPDLAMAVNGTGPGILAEETKRLGATLIHYSTDYVFDGAKGAPYTEADQPNPLNVYGATKLAGERAIQDVGGSYLIFRTAWVYSLRRPCFVTKVLSWARQHETLRIVDDQVSSPTWARTLAAATAFVIARGDLPDKTGLYHLADGGACSRFEWARSILEHNPHKDQHLAKQLLPAKTADFPTPAERPLYSSLDCAHLTNTFNLHTTQWHHALKLALNQ